MIGWKPTQSLRAGLEKLYPWIEERVRRSCTYYPISEAVTHGSVVEAMKREVA